MIANFLANYPWFLTILTTLGGTAEIYLGIKRPMDAGTLPVLLYRLLQRLFSKTKGAPVPIQSQTTPIAKETNDVVVLVLNLARDFKAGLKSGDMVGKEVGTLMTAVQDSDQIIVEMKADPVAWYRTVFGGFGELIAILTGVTK